MTAGMRLYLPVLAVCFVAAPAWAGQPLELSGVPHLFQVNEHIYRGAQPIEEGWASLAKLGIKTVIDLRRDGESGTHSIKAEAKAVEAAGMRYINIPMNGIVAPDDEQITRVMELFDSKEPVFVHCKLGKDRTGTVIACYRIGRDGWNNTKALAEAKNLGLHWAEIGMRRYIQRYRAPAVTELAAETKN